MGKWEFYRDQKLEEERKEWHENGQLMLRELYRDGRREGERKEWNLNGTIHSHFYYQNGNIRDAKFTTNKKFAILHVKRKLYVRRIFSTINSHIISDLTKLIF